MASSRCCVSLHDLLHVATPSCRAGEYIPRAHWAESWWHVWPGVDLVIPAHFGSSLDGMLVRKIQCILSMLDRPLTSNSSAGWKEASPMSSLHWQSGNGGDTRYLKPSLSRICRNLVLTSCMKKRREFKRQ